MADNVGVFVRVRPLLLDSEARSASAWDVVDETSVIDDEDRVFPFGTVPDRERTESTRATAWTPPGGPGRTVMQHTGMLTTR